MNIIIVGCGNIGNTLVEKLYEENHNIVVIDQDKKKIDAITDEADVLGVIGDGVDYQVLLKAGIEHTDLLIAATDSDEKNLLCAVIAKRSDKYCRTIACVNNPIYNTEISYLRRELGLSLILNPELIAAGEVARKFQYPENVEVNTFTRGRAELLHLKVTEDSPLCGCITSDLRSKFRAQVLICAIIRKRNVLIPNIKTEILAGDELLISATPTEANRFFKKVGYIKHPLKSVMIVGGGTTGYYLARRLVAVGIRTKVIESDEKRCSFLNEAIPKATIICGDGSDEKLLLREGLGGVGAFAALTGIDEENVLLSLFCRRVSHAKNLTKLNRTNYSDVMHNIQLDDVIFPSILTAEYIVKYVRSMSSQNPGTAENVFMLHNGKARVMEFFITEENAFTKRPISQLCIKKDAIICSITRDAQIILPVGREELRVGDNILILTTNPSYESLTDMEDI